MHGDLLTDEATSGFGRTTAEGRHFVPRRSNELR